MKKLFFLSLTILLVKFTYAQDYMDKIANQTCKCAQEIPDTLEQEKLHMQLGLCMLNSALPYKKQIKKDFGINLDNIDTEGKEFGRMIGVRLAASCPDLIIKLTQQSKESESKPGATLSADGTVTKIEND